MKKVLIASKKDPVFFIEHFCYDTTGHPYKLEPQQKLFLRDKSPYKILFCSRRSGKTLTMIADMLHKAFFRKNQQLSPERLHCHEADRELPGHDRRIYTAPGILCDV